MLRRFMPAVLAVVSLAGCAAQPPAEPAPTPAPTPESEAHRFASAIEAAHGRDAWMAHPALGAGIEVTFQGNTLLDGRITFATDMGRSRVDAGPASVIWDGKTAWVAPGDAEMPMARFHVLTWPYFALAPFKLRDPGAKLELQEQTEIQGRGYDTARLTFEPGVGDTPDDWYILYRDPDSSRLHSMAYIVTFGTTAEKAAAEPHAIVYEDYVELDGAPIPTRFIFYMWSDEQGIHGDPIGEVRLTGPQFVEPAPDLFTPPEGAREATMPAEPAD